MSYNIIFFPLIIIVIAIIVACIYYFIYKRNLNKALKENNAKHISMPSTGSILTGIVAAVLLICIININNELSDLRIDISMMQNYLSNDINQVYNNISDIQEQLKKDSGLLTSFEYECVNYDKKTEIYDVVITVIPKESNKNTEITVSTKNHDVKLTRQSIGKYTGTVSLKLSDNYEDEYAIVTINDGTTQKSEQVDSFYNFFCDVIPSLFASYEYDEPIYSKGNLKLGGTIYVQPSNTQKCGLKNCRIEIRVNGKVVDKEEIELPGDEEEKKIEINKNVKAKKSDLVEIYVIAEDELEMVHQSMLLSLGEDGEGAMAGFEEVYDKYGNVIW